MSDGILSSEEIESLRREVRLNGWDNGFPKFLHNTSSEKFSLISCMIGEGQVGWKFLLDLSRLRKVLIFDTTLGTVTESLAPNCETVYTINPDQRILECIGERLKEKRINNVRLLQCSKTKHLPFGDSFFDLIVLHDAETILPFIGMDPLKPKDLLAWLIREVTRTLHPAGVMFFSFQNRYGFHRIMKRFTGELDGYLTRNEKKVFTLSKVKGILRRAGLKYQRIYSVYPSLLNLKKLVGIRSFENSEKTLHFRHYLRDRLLNSGVFSPAFIVLASRRACRSFLDSFIQEVLTGDGRCRLQKYIVGTTVIVVAHSVNEKGNQSKFVIRLPVTEEAKTYCNHSTEVVKELKQLDDSISSRIPQPLEEGIYMNQPFFVETKLNGVAIDDPGSIFEQTFHDAIDFIIDLHQKTARRYKVDNALFDRLFLSYLKSFRDLLNKTVLNGSASLDTYLRKKLYGEEIPLVLQHGDLKLENILLDPETAAINGIIDWDLAELNGLPLLDIFHLLASRRRVLERRGLEDIITDIIIPLNFSNWEKEVFQKYMETLGIERRLLAPFAVLYWLHHINKRIRLNFMKKHPVWIEKNIVRPFK
ncbi:MAG: phosphotransferase, partial [Nitrospirota bacterium]